jgi:hypothetical protein
MGVIERRLDLTGAAETTARTPTNNRSTRTRNLAALAAENYFSESHHQR